MTILNEDIRYLRKERTVLYCPDGMKHGSIPYVVAYLKPRIVYSIKDIQPNEIVLFSWSYCYQDIGWIFDINNPIIIGGKHIETLYQAGISLELPRTSFWLKRIDIHENSHSTTIVPDFKTWVEYDPFVEWCMVYSGEGCYWGKCTFCNVNYDVPYVQFEPSIVAKAIIEANKYGKIAGLSGEAHTVKWLIELESYLPSGSSYDVYCRADQADWKNLKKCHQIFIGLEYLSNSVLRRIKKGVTAERIMDTITEIQSCGIDVESVIIIDLFENEDEIYEHSTNVIKLLKQTKRAGYKAGRFSLIETVYSPPERNLYILKNGEVIYGNELRDKESTLCKTTCG